MGYSQNLIDVLIFLAAALVLVPLFKQLRLSPILGYLTAGVLIGPHGFALIGDTVAADRLAQFGVVFLLFMIGLELSIDRLKSLRVMVFGLGSLQVIVTAILITGVALTGGLKLEVAAVIGAGLALSSTAFVLQSLTERNERATSYGLVSFSILLLQDLAIVPMLLLVTLLGGEGSSFLEAFWMAALKGGAAILVMIGSGLYLIRPMFRFITEMRSHELFVATTLLIVLGMGWIASLAGLSMELGALLAGVLLSGSEYRHQIEADIHPFRGILLGLFFVTIGMAIDVQFILAHIGLISLICVSLMAGKALIIFLLAMLFRVTAGNAVRTGFALSQGGEFGFVMFGAALGVNLIDEQVSQILYAVIALSMLATPLMFFLAKLIARALEKRHDAPVHSLYEADEQLHDHVLIVGFGRVGQTVARVISEAGFSYIAIDMDQKLVAACRAKGMPVYYGDVSQVRVIEAAGVKSAKLAVITLDEGGLASRTVAALHQCYPDLAIYVRARDRQHIFQLEELGATAVVPEAAESSLQLGSIVLGSLDVSSDEIQCVIQSYRDDDYARLGDVISLRRP